MNKLLPLLSLCVLIAFLASCSNKQYQNLFQRRNGGLDTTAFNYLQIKDQYRIQPQDILEVKNLQNNKDIVDLNPAVGGTTAVQAQPTQSQSAGHLVEDDGTIALTGLGRVKVAGLTRVEAEKLIEELYHKTLLKDPIIEVKVTNLAVIMFGEVKAPGSFPLVKDRVTLVQMLGAAGGLTENANEKNVRIIRNDHGKLAVIQIDLGNINSITDPKTILESGDIVYVEKNKRAIRNEGLTNLTQTVQPLLLLFSSLVLVYTLVKK